MSFISLSRNPRAVLSGSPKCLLAFPVPHSERETWDPKNGDFYECLTNWESADFNPLLGRIWGVISPTFLSIWRIHSVHSVRGPIHVDDNLSFGWFWRVWIELTFRRKICARQQCRLIVLLKLAEIKRRKMIILRKGPYRKSQVSIQKWRQITLSWACNCCCAACLINSETWKGGKEAFPAAGMADKSACGFMTLGAGCGNQGIGAPAIPFIRGKRDRVCWLSNACCRLNSFHI